MMGVIDTVAGILLILNANSIGLGSLTYIIAAILIFKGFFWSIIPNLFG